MRTFLPSLFSFFLFLSASLGQAARVGAPAPDFTATDSRGKTHRLSDLKGRFAVLEWHNQGCPFVKSQFKGKMQRLQKKWTAKGVLWFYVLSSAPGTEGSVTPAQAEADVQKTGASPTALFLDPTGTIGRSYDAKTTPHMFILNPQGILVYNGAIDNAPLVDADVLKNEAGEVYVNYVDRALDEMVVKGKPRPSLSSTAPYGCHVKYR